METGCRNSFSGGDDIDGQNGNFTNNAWDIWDISTTTTTTAVTPHVSTLRCHDYTNHSLLFENGVGSSNTHHNIPDPHMMCLKLGKRHYCDCLLTTDLQSAVKRVKPPGVRVASAYLPTTVVPRCQVEGCLVALVNSKDYYKRHKVCEIHSKAQKVVVLGLQQRFCQQCSRFHGVTEFDEAKRSCRRRLEGHNQRRRKGNFSHSQENNPKMEAQIRPLSTLPLPPHSNPGCALSLLSSPKTEPWISSDDLSSRCSAALYELIAANRATSVVGHFLNQNGSNQQLMDTLPQTQMWDRFSDADPTNTTLDLMQTSGLDFGLLSMKEKSKDPEEWTDYCWSTFGGANIV